MRKASGRASHFSAMGDGGDLDLLQGDDHVLPLSSRVAGPQVQRSLHTFTSLPLLEARRLGGFDAMQGSPEKHAGP